jgi:hypothetical protein
VPDGLRPARESRQEYQRLSKVAERHEERAYAKAYLHRATLSRPECSECVMKLANFGLFGVHSVKAAKQFGRAFWASAPLIYTKLPHSRFDLLWHARGP